MPRKITNDDLSANLNKLLTHYIACEIKLDYITVMW